MAIEGVAKIEQVIRALHFNEHGVIPVIVQDWRTGNVLMMAWANDDAVRRSAEDGVAWFWSRSRKQLWCKENEGDTRHWLRSMAVDKDQDTLMLQVEVLPAAHIPTQAGCFFYHIGQDGPMMLSDPQADELRHEMAEW